MDIKKTPPRFPGAGFLEFVWLLLRRALTRTSVGNKKYEYEDENRKLARADERGNQQELALLDHRIGAVAVRHGTDLKRRLKGMSSTLWKMFWGSGMGGACRTI